MTRHDAGEWLTAAADAHREAKQRERHSAEFLVATIAAARDDGMSLRAIAGHVGLSYQRVAQLLDKGKGE